MPILIRDVVQEFCNQIKSIFGERLSRIMIYGSYTRGDYTDSSDVDVMILVRIPETQIREYTDCVSDCAFEILMKDGGSIFKLNATFL